MSILIKGMNMPKTCAECRLCEGDTMDGLCHAMSKWFDDEYFRWYQYEEDDIDESKPVNCPLIEVPTPHGRLIDADELRRKMFHEAFETDTDMQMWDSGCWIRYKMFERVLKFAPTIIEAEEE